MRRNFNSSFISAKDKRASKSGVYGMEKHLLERMGGNFKSVVHEQAAAFNLKSVRFDGTNDYATVTASLVAKTISIWVKPDSTIDASSSRQCLLGFNSSEAGVYLGAGDTQLTNEVIRITDGYGSWGYQSASASLASSSWHHIVCVWHTSDSSTNSGNKGYDIYLNATKVGNAYGNFGVYGNRNFITTTKVVQADMARDGHHAYLDGFLDEVAIWNASLSSADITDIYNSGVPNDLTESASYDTDRTSNLIGYWRNGDGTENGSGTTIHDMSSNSNDMTLTNGPTYSDTVPS